MVELKGRMKPLVDDPRIGFVHVCLYVALLQWYETRKGMKVVYVQRREMMRLAKMKSDKTFYQTLNELIEWKYVKVEGWRRKGGRIGLAPLVVA